MKNTLMLASLALAAPIAFAGNAEIEMKAHEMMVSSFKDTGIAKQYRQYQLDFQRACSTPKGVDAQTAKRIEAAQLQTVKWPSDGRFLGDWKEGEKIAQSGRGLTWTDKTPHNNGGSCYNCHQLSPQELSFGTIGPSLYQYGKLRGNADEVVKYTWGKLWNAKAYNACSDMPRMGDADILTEDQIRHVMAYLFDPKSPVNQ